MHIEQNDTELASLAKLLAKEEMITLAIVFGSLAKGAPKPNSDIDIAVNIQNPLLPQQKMALIQSIAKLLGRPVDLIDLRTVGEPLLGQIIQYGKRIKGVDSELAKVALQHLYANEDFMPYLKRSLKERRERWIK